MLKIHLPAKEENVILVRLSQVQRALYTQFMDRFRDCGSSGWLGLNPLKAFCVCCKVRARSLGDTETQRMHVALEELLLLGSWTRRREQGAPLPWRAGGARASGAGFQHRAWEAASTVIQMALPVVATQLHRLLHQT